jgi:hypothetical protein
MCTFDAYFDPAGSICRYVELSTTLFKSEDDWLLLAQQHGSSRGERQMAVSRIPVLPTIGSFSLSYYGKCGHEN